MAIKNLEKTKKLEIEIDRANRGMTVTGRVGSSFVGAQVIDKNFINKLKGQMWEKRREMGLGDSFVDKATMLQKKKPIVQK